MTCSIIGYIGPDIYKHIGFHIQAYIRPIIRQHISSVALFNRYYYINTKKSTFNSCLQSEIARRREAEVAKLKKDFELLSVQHESSEASLRKRHQDAVNEMSEQIDFLNRNKAK